MYSRQQSPDSHFLENKLVGYPLWAHLLLGVATLGIYFLILPFIWLYATAQEAIGKAIAWVIVVAAATLYHVLKAPARAIYRQARRLPATPRSRRRLR